MTSVCAPVRYFLGTNTPVGFKSCVSSLYDSTNGWRTYILKGGAGTGKSTLLCSVYKNFGNEKTEAFCCSADPDSLDAVRLPDQKKLFIDGTAPHVLEPSAWNVSEELIPLFLATQKGVIESQASTILLLNKKVCDLHTGCQKLLKIAQDVLVENQHLEKKALQTDKIEKLAKQLAKNEWVPLQKCGIQENRFISAITPDGYTVLSGTIQALCPRIFVIEDEHGTVANILLKRVLDHALADGQRCIVCPHPLFAESSLEHLLLPDIGVAFVSSTRFHRVDYPVFRRLHSSRFLNMEALQKKQNFLRFQSKAVKDLLQQAAQCMSSAKTVHKQLEAQYAAATDWKIVDTLTNELLDSLAQNNQ